MNNNTSILMEPCDYTNNFEVVNKLDNLVAINSTVEVDFLGQCNSESVKGMYYSSTGGQADFMKGVRLTKNGTGIICLYSTAKKEQFLQLCHHFSQEHLFQHLKMILTQ